MISKKEFQQKLPELKEYLRLKYYNIFDHCMIYFSENMIQLVDTGAMIVIAEGNTIKSFIRSLDLAVKEFGYDENIAEIKKEREETLKKQQEEEEKLVEELAAQIPNDDNTLDMPIMASVCNIDGVPMEESSDPVMTNGNEVDPRLNKVSELSPAEIAPMDKDSQETVDPRENTLPLVREHEPYTKPIDMTDSDYQFVADEILKGIVNAQ